MKIAITGTSSGVGKELSEQLCKNYEVVCITRDLLDLADLDAVTDHDMPVVDMLINCAGTDRGGKTAFTDQDLSSISNFSNLQ